MFRYVLRHINLLVMTLLVLSLLSFLLAYLFPGEPLINLSGLRQISGEQEYASLAVKYRVADNIFLQYWQYLVLLFEGDWGLSFSSGQSLYQEISQTLPASIELSTYALLVSLLLGIPLGIVAGLRYHKSTDYALLSASVLGYSIPVFWLALILILVFSLQFGWLPLSGRISLLFDVPYNTGFILIDIWLSDIANKHDAVMDALRHLLLPTCSIAIVTSTLILRITRRSMIEVMSSDFIKAAGARGLSQQQLVFRHGVRNAILPILPLLASQFATLLTNAMIVEIVFSWPGIGNWLIQAIYQRDYPAIRAGMFAVSGLVIIFTISIDIFIRFIDPTKSRANRAKI
jgi:cationic peptide transport system permease protein